MLSLVGIAVIVGIFWRAVAKEPIPVDTIVQIVEQKDLVLKVHPLPTFKAEQGDEL